jgi:transposase
MQGKKTYTEQLFTGFQLSDHVPEDNFYRRLKSVLDLRFMRKLTAPYYGTCGQTRAEPSRSESIDPEVFIKIMPVGYPEKLPSGRQEYLKFTQKRVETVAMSAEKHLLYFLELICLVLRPNPSFKF